ncbi:MAG: hypothetical protein WAP23_02330 [Candidatus Spechtbacterales bacterium]
MTQIILIILGIAIVVILLSRKSRENIVGICSSALDQTVRKNTNKERVAEMRLESEKKNMEKQQNKLINWPTKKLGPTFVVLIVVAVATFGWFYSGSLSWLTLLVITLTLAVLIWYAHDTHRIANESVSQTELETRPIMCLYVRYINGIKDEEEKLSVKEKYSITHQVDNGIVPSPYYFALHNMGKGPAFNVEMESENFKAEKYQTRFFEPEPKGDEHAVKIIRKPSNKIRGLDELKGEEFTIKCRSVLGKSYEYKYKIIDITEREVEFMKSHD